VTSHPALPSRLLLVNWRDPEHPKAGGAEVLTVRWAQAWSDAGVDVTMVTNRFPGAEATARFGDVPVFRQGNPLTQWWLDRRFWRRHGPFDLVVEEINTVPHLSPLWARRRSVLLIFQLAREVWFYEAPRTVARLGHSVEPFYLRLYNRGPALTISASTQQDLVDLGFSRDHVHVVPVGVDPAIGPLPSKDAAATFVFVGRLAPSKRVDHIIRAFASARAALGVKGDGARLHIVGAGPDEHRAALAKVAAECGVLDAVVFHGRVSEGERTGLLARATALVMASAREGWGLVVSEAGAVGTPSIAYAVPGLRDSIEHGATGLLATAETPDALARPMIELASDRARAVQMGEAARARAARLDWATSCDEAVGALARAAAQMRKRTVRGA
jgi:glycosyltransferase involved in cell wall biosynthesis